MRSTRDSPLNYPASGGGLRAEDPKTVRFRSLDEKSCLPGKRQQVTIAAYQQTGFAALREVQERLIVGIPTNRVAPSSHLDDFAVRKILSQQFTPVVGREVKFPISENPRKFRRGAARNQGYAACLTPMLTKPCQAAIGK